MAIFDKFVKAVNETSQSALQRGREMAEVSKVNSKIAEERSALYQCYYSLGEYYYQNCRQEDRQEFQPFVEAITNHLQQMEQLEKELQSLKGLISCPGCGRSIPKNTVFCSFCGKKAVTHNVSLCKGCGAVAPEGTAFCTRCGMQMETIYSDAVVPEADSSICVECGEKLDPNNQFCASCGAKVPASVPVIELSVQAEAISLPDHKVEADTGDRRLPEINAISEVAESENLDQKERQEESQKEAWENSEPPVRKCPACGEKLDENQVFCHSCGYKI